MGPCYHPRRQFSESGEVHKLVQVIIRLYGQEIVIEHREMLVSEAGIIFDEAIGMSNVVSMRPGINVVPRIARHG